jgi:hypothetical protein
MNSLFSALVVTVFQSHSNILSSCPRHLVSPRAVAAARVSLFAAADGAYKTPGDMAVISIGNPDDSRWAF